MSLTRLVIGAVGALLLCAVLPRPAAAQFGSVFGQFNLPDSDFTWIWGRRAETALGRAEDFSLAGSEGGFRCTLEGKMSPGAGWSMGDIRELENQLNSSLFFIQSSANAMYTLDQQLDLDWAKLDCAKSQATVDEERAQELEDKARAKAERARERRRARQRRDEEG